jgi:tRNA A-37 threonylcarbamoyl transferase component Bud32
MNQQIKEQTQISEAQWSAAMNSNKRIEKIKTEEGVYWLKKSAPARGIFRYYVLNIFSSILSAPLLKAVPQKGGQVALDTESKRIKLLKLNGIIVPNIIAEDSGWLLLENLGDSIIHRMKQNRDDLELVRYLFKICLTGVKELHLKGQYLSQGFVRNILQINQSDEVGFIDFEDDPLDVLTLEQAQARDLLLFVNSTARFFVKDDDYFNQQIHQFLKGHNKEVVDNIKQTNSKMLWITKLPFQKLLGHDYQKLKMGILALDQN